MAIKKQFTRRFEQLRAIVFRAKTVTTDRWAYGHYAFVDEYHVIYEEGKPFIIRLNTLGQHTGLEDKDDRDIYEGSIVIGKRSSHWHEGFDKVKGIVTYRNETASFDIDSSSSKALMNGGSLYKTEELEIIGNIYEDSHLLETE